MMLSLLNITIVVSYSRETNNYQDVMQSCRHAWNAMRSQLDTPTDRAGLKDLLVSIITSVLKLIGRNSTSSSTPTDEDCQILMDMMIVLMNIYQDQVR